MNSVNPIYIDYLFGNLSGKGDSEEDIKIYGIYNTNYEHDVKLLATQVLKAIFENQPTILKEKVKDTLAFYLLNDKIDLGDRVDSLLLPFESPTNAKIFFQWIWEILFEGESFEYIENRNIIEEFDVNSPYYLLRPPQTNH